MDRFSRPFPNEKNVKIEVSGTFPAATRGGLDAVDEVFIEKLFPISNFFGCRLISDPRTPCGSFFLSSGGHFASSASPDLFARALPPPPFPPPPFPHTLAVERHPLFFCITVLPRNTVTKAQRDNARRIYGASASVYHRQTHAIT